MQQIFEAIQSSNGSAIFLGFIQYELEAYLSHIDKTSNVIRYVGRYSSSEKYYLSSNFETILANLLKKNNSEEFDNVIGLYRLLVVHVNDTKNPIGAHKDRHENIGYGYLGFDTLYKVVHHPLLKGIPMILETPYYNEKAPYKQEIEMLRSGKFIKGWRD